MQSVTERENEILRKWRKRDEQFGERPPFIKDGIIDPSRWAKAKPKVLLLLKEAYDSDPGERGWDLRKKLLRNPPDPGTWRVAAYWCFAAHSGRGSLRPFPETWETASRCLRSSAIINVKKSGGQSRSSNSALCKHALSRKDLLRQQIEIIGPDLVICGSTWGFVKELFSPSKKVAKWVYRSNSTLFVDFWHPADLHDTRSARYKLLGHVLRKAKARPLKNCHCRK